MRPSGFVLRSPPGGSLPSYSLPLVCGRRFHHPDPLREQHRYCKTGPAVVSRHRIRPLAGQLHHAVPAVQNRRVQTLCPEPIRTRPRVGHAELPLLRTLRSVDPVSRAFALGNSVGGRVDGTLPPYPDARRESGMLFLRAAVSVSIASFALSS